MFFAWLHTFSRTIVEATHGTLYNTCTFNMYKNNLSYVKNSVVPLLFQLLLCRKRRSIANMIKSYFYCSSVAGRGQVRFSQTEMCWSSSDLIENAQRFAWTDLDPSRFEKERNDIPCKHLLPLTCTALLPAAWWSS